MGPVSTEEAIKTIFKAYDIRGVFGKELTLDLVYNIGRAFATKIGFGKKISVSKDTRNSGNALLESFILGLLDSGCISIKIDTIPVPVLGYYTWSKNFDAGVYISASHNPPEYNGIRFRGRDGSGMLYKELNMEEIIIKNQFRELAQDEQKNVYSVETNAELVLQEYFDFITKRVTLDKAVRIVLDPGNGSGYRMLPLYQKIGCEAVGINMIPDGRFPNRMPEPKKETLIKTVELVRDIKADFGVAFDADADRGIIIDDKGRIITPEKIAVLLARELGEGKIVASMDCSLLLEKELEDSGYKIIREKVGDVFISQAVKKHKAVIGVERSGHFFIPKFHASDDPFAMSSVLAEILSKSNKNLSQLADEIKEYPYYSESIPCPENIKFNIIEKLKEELLKHENWVVELKDGLRISTEDWVVLIRASHTEPKIRLYIETTVNNLNELVKEFKDRILRTIHTIS